MSWPVMAAFVVMGVMALLLISGPWTPRLVEKDPAGMVVGGSPRPLAPGTPITHESIYRGGRSDRWVKVKNRQHPAFGGCRISLA
jgi:hypothetical protein